MEASQVPNSVSQGFNLLREDNTDTSGGLMVYTRSDIPRRRLTAVEYNKDGIESICIKVILGNTKTVIACIYKHPRVENNVFKTVSCSISDQLFRNYSDAFFIGDMNSYPNKIGVIKYICVMYSLHNLIKNPTCHKAATSTLLGVGLVSNRTNIFVEANYINDITSAPFHVCEVFDGVEDMVWFTNELLLDIVNHHALVKRKLIKRESVP